MIDCSKVKVCVEFLRLFSFLGFQSWNMMMNWSRYSFSFSFSFNLPPFWFHLSYNILLAALIAISLGAHHLKRDLQFVIPLNRENAVATISLSLFIHLACAQVYHVCALDKTFSFLCPNGTIFDQRVFVCRWWHNVDCASSANYYNLNDLIGISPATQQPAVRNPIHFPSATSYGPAAAPTKLVVQQQQQQQPIQSSTTGVSQKPLKQIYGPPPSSAVLQPVLIEEAIRRPSSGLKAPAIQPTASSAY